jgi:NADH-quinone oxidoreductase subunit J
MEQLAILLYQKFIYFFFLSGVILLISMIGAIILTLNQKFLNKRQDAYKQTIKSFKNSIRYIKNKSYKKNTYI